MLSQIIVIVLQLLFHSSPSAAWLTDSSSRPRDALFRRRVPSSSPLGLNQKPHDADDAILDRTFLERNQHWIVFVDDEEAIRQSVGDFLYDSGYQVTACADAAACVEVCEASVSDKKRPACIVSDIRMPGMDGIALLRWIREDSAFQRIPVVLLTAKGLTSDRVAGYKAGADVYLPKPFYPEELLSAVDNLIARRKQMTNSLVDVQQELAEIKSSLTDTQPTIETTSVFLTPVEREVLDLLCGGFTNGEIAEQRGTSKPVVQKTIKKIYDKTSTKSRTELLKWAVKKGYVDLKL